MTNPTAAILIIGNEILSGRTQDANTQFLCQHLTQIGIDVIEVRMIHDDAQKIIETVRELSSAHTYVFTTGGLGATHDDITAACMALAFDKPLVKNPKAVAILSDFYQDRLNEARLRMALMPEDSILIDNPVSTAPGFQIENVFCLAGVPSIMRAMLETLIPRLNHGAQIFQVTVGCKLTENTIADELAQIQANFPTVEIGSYPYFQIHGDFGVNLVLRSRDKDELEQSLQIIEKMIVKHGIIPEREETSL
jgi:molybdenum cofactor synthesis domain-containing protein